MTEDTSPNSRTKVVRKTKSRPYRTKAHVSNNAVRMFLWSFGVRYDELRGYSPFDGKNDFREVLLFFDGRCCYCGTSISEDEADQDHLVAINKDFAGLHAWGNIVPSCGTCNGDKQGKPWAQFLSERAGADMASRYSKISEFVRHYKYEPNVAEIKAVAAELYDELGKIAQVLIDAKITRCSNLQIHR